MPAPDAKAPDGDLELLREVAREAGNIARRYFRQDPQVWYKGGTSPVSEADYAVDKYLRETLTAARPDYGWLSEETVDDHARLGARRLFIADPIDGTRGFLDGLPQWCVCVAVVEDGKALAGVLDCPATGEQFHAAIGEGAWERKRRLSVAAPREALVIGGPQAFFNHLPMDIQKRARRHPHVPSLAYRIALIAAGRMDATFVKANAHDWDIAAASILLEEAGGRIAQTDGSSPSYGAASTAHGALAAGSGPLLDTMVAVLAED